MGIDPKNESIEGVFYKINKKIGRYHENFWNCRYINNRLP